jgi:hypothetical protein
MMIRLGTVAMTPAQSAAWYAALPWYVKPFASAEGAIQSGFCSLLPNNSACLTASNPLYTQPVATATAPGLPVGYDPFTGTVSGDNITGATDVVDYASAIAQSLPSSSPDGAPGGFSVPGWLWIALAVVAAVFLIGGKRRR